MIKPGLYVAAYKPGSKIRPWIANINVKKLLKNYNLTKSNHGNPRCSRLSR